MEYPRPARMGGASWGFPFPLGHVAPAGPHPANWNAPLADMFALPWTGAGAGQHAAPWTRAGAGKYAAPWAGAGAGKYAAPWAGAGAGQYASPWTGAGAGKQAAPWAGAGAGKYAAPWAGAGAGQYASPWAGAGAGQYASPWAGAGAGQYAAPWAGAGAGKYAAPWAGAGKLVPDGTPPFGGGLYPFPDHVTGDDLMSQPQMVIDLVTLIEPALESVLPAIQGLLQIPALLMEEAERADLLGRWSDVTVALMPGAEEESPPSTEFGPGESSPGSSPQQDP